MKYTIKEMKNSPKLTEGYFSKAFVEKVNDCLVSKYMFYSL